MGWGGGVGGMGGIGEEQVGAKISGSEISPVILFHAAKCKTH